MQTIIHNATLVNEGRQFVSDILLRNGIIERIDPSINVKHKVDEIKGDGLILMPGVIDDQVHFREPGLTHKGNIASESAAAVAGGITSFMEMSYWRKSSDLCHTIFQAPLNQNKFFISTHGCKCAIFNDREAQV